jgi:membrane fusion protein (multidrug efflux system)
MKKFNGNKENFISKIRSKLIAILEKIKNNTPYLKNFNNKSNWLLIISGTFLVMLAIGYIYLTRKEKDFFADDATSVQAAKVNLGSINIKADFAGKIRAPESVMLTSEVVGKIIKMRPDGAFVNKGEIILELEETEARGKYMVALGKKNEEEHRLNSTKKMVAEGYKTQNHLNEQLARYQTAQGHLMEASAYLQKHNIKAPFDGIVGLQNQNIGTTINQHTKLVNVTNLNNLQVEFLVSESQLRNLGGIEQLKKAEILLILGSELLPIEATFHAYESVLDAETNAIAVRALLKQGDNKRAYPGEMAKVIINVGAKDNILTIPQSALQTGHGKTYVFKVMAQRIT